ncbi:hypothetical protein H0H93_008441 [Arthromyces matolae]|nr:hypothetical protein H0H93_008441 [Arthromyces matolae]
MSGSYRLETPRPRQPPPAPLRFTNNPSLTSSSVLAAHGEQTLLYDLPSTSSMTPPTSPQLKGRLISPTSPTFSPRSRRGAPTPPPSGRNRSSTPSAVAPSELETFAVHCRAWYFNQDEESGRQMTQTMSTLPASQRAPFARLQASIRADYHRSVNARKNAEFQAHITSMQPGGSLSAHSRADPQGNLAKKERYERMQRFISSWCTMGMPGTQPFFEAYVLRNPVSPNLTAHDSLYCSLWAIMRLQVIPENLGGAGSFRIEWEFDDAVFKEAAQVLAFEDFLSSKHSSSNVGLSPDPAAVHSRSQSQPLPSDRKPPKINSIVQPKRARAPSDPFLDTPALSRQVAPALSHSSAGATTALLSGPTHDGITEESHSLEDNLTTSYNVGNGSGTDEDYMRIWTSPDLTNPELLELLKLFPAFVSRRPLPRFAGSNARHPDIEEGDDEDVEGNRIHIGTGSLWVSSRPRLDGWQGGWWTRFVLWWRRMVYLLNDFPFVTSEQVVTDKSLWPEA